MDVALEIRDVCKKYRDFSLENVSLTLPRGYIMGLVGPNGAGKTTLIKLIMNLVRRDSGSIRVFGFDCRSQERETKARIGFVPDEPQLHADASLNDIKVATAPFYPQWDETCFRTMAAEFGLPLKKKFKTLSHGTKTKFALALALSHHAELLVLDEPTSGLDPVFRRELLATLAGLIAGGNVAVLFSSHITSDLEQKADFVTFIRNGRLVFSSRTDEVKEQWGVVKGGRELLDETSRTIFTGFTIREHGFEGLTADVREAQRRFGESAIYERASLDDIIALTGKGVDNAR